VSTRTEILQARLVVKEAQLLLANTTLSDLLTQQIEAYKFSDQTGRQEAINLDIAKIMKLISLLEKEIDNINNKLTNNHVRYIRLRR
jgi:hypothetical protein